MNRMCSHRCRLNTHSIFCSLFTPRFVPELEAPLAIRRNEQVQERLGGTTLRRFIEATDRQPLEALQAFPHKITVDHHL